VGDAEGGEFGGGGVVGSDAPGEFGACEQSVVGVSGVVLVEFGRACIVVPLGVVELVGRVDVGAEDGTESFEGTLGAQFGVEIVEDREVDQGLGFKTKAKVGLGAEVEEVELEIHSDDGAGVGQPSGKVSSVGLDVHSEDEG
jgi:hypothetical protein